MILQIFDELRKVGKQHQFSAGLLIGGKQVKAEQQHVNGEGRQNLPWTSWPSSSVRAQQYHISETVRA